MGVCVLLLFLILFLVFMKRKYRREVYEKNRKRIRMPSAVFCSGLFLSEYLQRKSPSGQDGAGQEVFQATGEKKALQEGLQGGRILLVLFMASLSCLMLVVFSENRMEIRALRRPGFGDIRKVELVAEDASGKWPVSVSVSGKAPDENEAGELFDRTFAEMSEIILNGNPSFSMVTKDLSFPRQSDSKIRLSYHLSRTDLLSSDGRILVEELPSEGGHLVLTVTLSFGAFEKSYPCDVTVLPVQEEKMSRKEQLDELLMLADENSREDENLVLPDTVGGAALKYYPKTTSPYLILIAGFALSLWMAVYPGERAKERLKRRKESLLREYPSFLMKLSMYLQTGLSIRSAWERILKESGTKDEAAGFFRKKRSEKDALYEEMRTALRNMDRGRSESLSYLEFGQRTGLSCYRRLGSFLARNLRQGLSGAEDFLAAEMEKALEEKRNEALRRGEEAGTKLLFPMVLLLGIVLMLLVIPAFMMFY